MVENPFDPPKSNLNSLPDSTEVFVRSRFPLDISARKIIQLNDTSESLNQRVLFAALACGYNIQDQTENAWKFSRGSHWHAIYTFSIRKLPTTVTITMLSPARLEILLHCRSLMSLSTSGDEKRVSNELDLFEGRLVDNQ